MEDEALESEQNLVPFQRLRLLRMHYEGFFTPAEQDEKILRFHLILTSNIKPLQNFRDHPDPSSIFSSGACENASRMQWFCLPRGSNVLPTTNTAPSRMEAFSTSVASTRPGRVTQM